MANRSYLIGIDSKGKDKIIADYAYDIPVFFKVFVSVNPRVVKSTMYESENGTMCPTIEADFKEGQEKLINYIDVLLNSTLSSYGKFKEKLETEKQTISNYSYDKVCLDCLEIYCMHGDETIYEKENNELLYEIKNIDAEIEKYNSNLEEELKKYSELISTKPKGLFKKKKQIELDNQISRKEMEINNLLCSEIFLAGNPDTKVYFDQEKEKSIEILKAILKKLHEKKYDEVINCVDESQIDDLSYFLSEYIQKTLDINGYDSIDEYGVECKFNPKYKYLLMTIEKFNNSDDFYLEYDLTSNGERTNLVLQLDFKHTKDGLKCIFKNIDPQ